MLNVFVMMFVMSASTAIGKHVENIYSKNSTSTAPSTSISADIGMGTRMSCHSSVVAIAGDGDGR